MKILIILLILISANAQAKISLGISTMYFNDDLHYENDKFRPSLNAGWFESFGKIVAGVYTTRLNHSQKRSLENGFDIKSKVDSDILKIGRRYNRFIYSGFVSNTGIKTTVLNHSQKEHFIGYGFGVDYLLTKHITIGLGAIMPNKIGHGAYTNLSYNF
ncbi:MAG: hypothetical protein ACJASR_000149 [Psychroserpens sp.]|jgi:hypothetical protein